MTEGRLRAVTFNLWGEQEPLAARMALCTARLAALDLDVLALQEVRQIDGRLPNQAETLARDLGLRPVFAGTTEWGGGLEGLALLSRLPIVDHGHLELPHACPQERRILLWAVLRHPAGEVLACSTHLNFRLHHGAIREDQVAAIDAELAGRQAAVKLLMGDFNATPDSDEIRFLRGLHSAAGRRTYYQDAFARLHPGEAGFTWSAKNPYTRRLGWLDPDRRLDYIFVSPMSREGRGVVHCCDIVLDDPAPDGTLPSDHYGLMAEVQVAPLPFQVPPP